MFHSLLSRVFPWMTIALSLACVASVNGQHPPRANVPPTMEIEVLDPNADPLGRPAVELYTDAYGALQVDIPPVVLVHRYYYSGDRSFQAQLLPGGPTIIVAPHPGTGERCYIEVTMPPGAPEVSYFDHGIKYDYGSTSILLKFGRHGPPTVVYRNGPTIRQRVANVLHTEDLKDHATGAYSHLRSSASRTQTMAYGAAGKISGATDMLMLPVKNTAQMLPFGKVIFSEDLGNELVLEADRHHHEKELKRTARERKLNEASIRTLR